MKRNVSKLFVPLILTVVFVIPIMLQPSLVKATPDAGDAWSEPVNITPILNDGYLNYKNSLLVDDQSNIHVVYYSRTSDAGPTEIFYVSNKTGEWVNTQISNQGSYAVQYEPVIASDSRGVLHIMWTGLISGKGEIFYTNNTNNVWHTPVNVTNTVDISETGVSFVIDSADNIHLVYSVGDNVYYTNRTYSGVWATPKQLFTSPYKVISIEWIDITVSAGDKLYIGVKALNGTGGFNYHNIYSFDGVSSSPVFASGNLSDSDLFSLTADRHGYAHLAYNLLDDSGYSLIYQFYNGSAWGAREVILNGTVEGFNSIYSPSISCDYDGKPHIAVIVEELIYKILYTNKTQGVWNSPVLVVGDEDFYSYTTNIQIDKKGFAHIVFDYYPSISESQIVYTHTLEPVGTAWPIPPPIPGDLTLIIIIIAGVSAAGVIAGISVYMLKKH
ncbi:MAG: hypothetical protein QW739_02950 [Candidatus Odinarchaeota archaeon]